MLWLVALVINVLLYSWKVQQEVCNFSEFTVIQFWQVKSLENLLLTKQNLYWMETFDGIWFDETMSISQNSPKFFRQSFLL